MGPQAPCALWFVSTRVRACELKCFFLFFFQVNFLCGSGCGLCSSKSRLGQHIIYRWSHILSLLTGTSNLVFNVHQKVVSKSISLRG